MRLFSRLLTLVSLCLVLAGTASATVTSTANTIVGLGNGATTQFTFNFIGVRASDIVVTYTDAVGNATILTQGVQYTLSLNATVPGAIWGVGGSVTYPLAGSPIATGTTLTISRQMPLTQTTTSNQGQLFPQAVEQGLDTGVMQTQQINNAVAHAIVTGSNDTCGSIGVLPSPVQRASQIIGFDATGCNPIVAQPSSALVSSAMQPVVAAASIPAAQILLGIGTSANVPVGMEADWPGLTAPPYWKLEDGTPLPRTTYSGLLAVLAPVVPCTITAGSATITGISSTVGWAPGWIIESPGSGALTNGHTIAIVGGSSVTINGGVASVSATSCRIFPYGTAQDGTFSLPNAAGVAYVGIDLAGINITSTYCGGDDPTHLNAPCGQQATGLTTQNLPPYTPVGTVATSISTPGVKVGTASNVFGTGATPAVAGTVEDLTGNITASSTFTGTPQGGTTTPFSRLPPMHTRNRIIFTGVL